MKRTFFQNLLAAHKGRVFSHAYYFLRNREDAEDVTQEVFLKLWNHWEAIDKEKAESWLMRVTHRQCIDAYRRRARLRLLVAPSAAGGREPDWVNTPPPADHCPAAGNPEEEFELNETHRTLLDAMDGLPAITRSLMLMHYFEGLAHNRIAEIMGMTETAVKVAVHRGRRAMGEILKAKHPEWVEEKRTCV
jgi:RNA polymerase sigma-70 factor (ECF subfamily)